MAVARRTQSEAVRKEQILAAARKVFKEKGFDGSTISDIVAEAGVAQGTFYLYFASKKEAVLALAETVLAELARGFRAGYDPSMSFEEKLRAVVRVAFEVGSRNPDLCRLVHFGAESVAQEFEESVKHHEVHMDMVQMFQEAIDAGEMEPTDPVLAARLLAHIIPSALQESFVFGDGSRAEEIESLMAQILVNGLKRQA